MNIPYPLTDRRLARKIRRAVRVKLRRGEINEDQAHRLTAGSRDANVVARWRKTLEQPVYGAPWVGKDPKVLTGIDWASIWAWLMDNWPTILRVLLSLLVFLGENPDETDSPS